MGIWTALFSSQKHAGRIVGGPSHVTITIRNELLPEHLRKFARVDRHGDWGGPNYPSVDLTKEECESVGLALPEDIASRVVVDDL